MNIKLFPESPVLTKFLEHCREHGAPIGSRWSTSRSPCDIYTIDAAPRDHGAGWRQWCSEKTYSLLPPSFGHENGYTLVDEIPDIKCSPESRLFAHRVMWGCRAKGVEAKVSEHAPTSSMLNISTMCDTRGWEIDRWLPPGADAVEDLVTCLCSSVRVEHVELPSSNREKRELRAVNSAPFLAQALGRVQRSDTSQRDVTCARIDKALAVRGYPKAEWQSGKGGVCWFEKCLTVTDSGEMCGNGQMYGDIDALLDECFPKVKTCFVDMSCVSCGVRGRWHDGKCPQCEPKAVVTRVKESATSVAFDSIIAQGRRS